MARGSKKREWKMLRMILGTKIKNGQIKLGLNKALCQQTEEVIELMKKVRLKFYGLLLRMDKDMLTIRIFELFRLRETEPKWFRGVRIDLTKMG